MNVSDVASIVIATLALVYEIVRDLKTEKSSEKEANTVK
jgi:hypothetical protein